MAAAARRRLLLACLAAALAAACHGDHPQSSLQPSGPQARVIAELWWVMLAAYGAAFLVTMGAAWIAVRRRAPVGTRPGPPGGDERFVMALGIAMPAVVLVGVLIYSLFAGRRMRAPATALEIEVVGRQWWWDVEHLGQGVVTANELHIPAGRPVRLRLRSLDVIHSFWVPRLHGKTDMLPDRTNVIWLQADAPGVYRGQCAEYCGDQHARMAFEVVVMEPEDYERWLEERRRPAPEPAEPLALRGREVFFEAGCQVCHSVLGTQAKGRLGPDLSHLAQRRLLGAATVANTRERLAQWVVDPQAIKPGNRMPPTDVSPADLDALVTWLESLR